MFVIYFLFVFFITIVEEPEYVLSLCWIHSSSTPNCTTNRNVGYDSSVNLSPHIWILVFVSFICIYLFLLNIWPTLTLMKKLLKMNERMSFWQCCCFSAFDIKVPESSHFICMYTNVPWKSDLHIVSTIQEKRRKLINILSICFIFPCCIWSYKQTLSNTFLSMFHIENTEISPSTFSWSV